ncbi:hypothetical protein [Chrysiogenes arsenatis]|uniref:hypothetical protein n=1 Tax=Chrysiogenes arsenatis TaxID=309797 RepID=UPI0003F9307A|nr:hypothetical protein [Chrysiogenes arsenatis]
MTLTILFIAIFAFLVNLPLGYIRPQFRKFSFQWLLVIHAPIPFVAALRIFYGVEWLYIPLFLALSICGQIIGSRYRLKNLLDKPHSNT